MSRVLVISLSDIGSDPRVDRQIEFLLSDFDVVAAGLGAPRQDIEFHRLAQTLSPSPGTQRAGSPGRHTSADRVRAVLAPYARHLTQRTRGTISVAAARTFRTRRALAPYPRSYWMDRMFGEWVRQLMPLQFDAVVVNDTVFLPAGLALAQGRPVVFDAHEYSPAEREGDLMWQLEHRRMVKSICRREIPRAAGFMTVGNGVAQAYQRLVGREPAVVTNAPWFQQLDPSPVSPESIRMVHWGIADPQRQLELLFDVVRELDDRYSLDVILVPGVPEYLEHLKLYARDIPRVVFRDRVPMPELPRFGNDFDIGLYPLPAVHLNQEYALPNKFFEFVQARLAVALGPSPEMSRIAAQHDFGIVAPDFTPGAISAAIRRITPERLRELKSNAATAAPLLSAEHNANTVRTLVHRALDH